MEKNMREICSPEYLKCYLYLDHQVKKHSLSFIYYKLKDAFVKL